YVRFQGHDTTAMGISWALFLIGHSPEAQQKIHDELDSIFGDDTERHVSHEDMKEMRYLECVIKESQRIYPSVPFYSRLCEEPFELGELPHDIQAILPLVGRQRSR
ncbi:cytochrome P450, putative, partial [Ixodes scapularis]